MSKIAILFNDVSHASDPADLDVLTQCRQVFDSLARSGHDVSEVACTLDLAAVRTELQCLAPDVVFNLVESLGGTDRLMSAATLLLDAMQLDYTGADTRAILLSGDKLQAKRMMAAAAIPTPAWFDEASATVVELNESSISHFIIKANYEHASFAMRQDAVLEYQDGSQLRQKLADRLQSTGRDHLAEQFIAGREFNLSLLEIDGQPQVLAPAEIDFRGLPDHLPRIVGASAKWNEASIEYQQTPRRFDFPKSDRTLLAALSELAIRCWNLFGLRGYGRVDFRVSENGGPFVLEVNANPCLSQDAGFIAAAAQSQMTFDRVIDAILAAHRGSRQRLSQAPCERRQLLTTSTTDK